MKVNGNKLFRKNKVWAGQAVLNKRMWMVHIETVMQCDNAPLWVPAASQTLIKDKN